jgi:hypothetical protein
MKFLKTDVWRLKVPVFLSAHERIPVALSIAAAGGDVEKDWELILGMIWVWSGLRRGNDRSIW